MEQTTACVPARTIGIDLSDKASSYCVLDGDGKVCQEGKFESSPESLRATFADFPRSRFVLEVCSHVHWVAWELLDFGHEVIPANPRRVELISKSTRKTDRNDAHTLARLGRIDPDLLGPVQLRDKGCLSARTLLGARSQLVQTRTRLVNMVRTECKVHGVQLPTCAIQSFPKIARAQMPEILHRALMPILETLDGLMATVRHYDKEIEGLCKESYPQTEVLRQVRGVGPQVALAFVTTIGDPERFKDSRDVGAYVGLVPRSYQSGASDPNLRITKQGDRTLRALLVTAATHIMRRSSPDSSLKRFGCRIASRGNPRDRARARIAVARKLAVLLHRLLVTGEVYDPLRNAA